jgi:hypothetical protein
MIDTSVVRRRVRRLLHAAACAAAAVALASGCERPPEPTGDRDGPAAGITEEEFVEHVAALTVAVEDGLAGEQARDRAAELGGGSYTREEIDAFAEVLRADPERWAAVAERIDRRIAELRSEGPGANARPGEPDQPRDDSPTADAPMGEPRGDAADAP